MSAAEPGPEGSGDDGSSSIWEDVTQRQPERAVPEADAPPVFERPRQPAPGQGAPVFVNPDRPAPGQVPPQFVKPDGTPAGGGQGPRSVQPHPGGPVFVQPGGGPPVGAGIPGIPGGQPGYAPVAGGPIFVHPDPQPSPVDSDRPWRWWLGPLGILVALFGIVPAQIALVVAIKASEGGSETDIVERYAHWFGLMQDVCWVAIVVLLPFLVVKHLRPEQLGLRRAPLGRSIGVLLAAVVVFYVFAALYASALGLEENDNTMLQDTGFGDAILKDVVFALLFTVAAPVAEELLFRGLLFRTLRDGLTSKWGPRGGLAGGAIISGLVFGGVHLGGGQDDFLPVLMLLGIVLALAYHWSGSLYVPIAIHAVNNAMATGFNSDPAADWIYGLIAIGPVIALLTAYGIGQGIKRVFPPVPKDSARMPAEEHATL